MALLAIVSAAAFCGMGYMTQQNILSNIENALSGAIEETQTSGLPYIGHDGSGKRKSQSSIPAYCVTVTWDGSIYADSNLITQMDEDVLKNAVATAVNACNGLAAQGNISDYSLYFKIVPKDLGYRIAFADSSSYEQTIKATVGTFAAAWVALMIVLFAITMYLARYVTQPVRTAWENQQRFIADASHELKTPLTVILADASILAKNPDKTMREQQTWLKGISSEAERMQHLTEDLLTLAQADAGSSMTPAMCDVDLSQLAQRACLQFEAAAFERGLMIEDDIEDGIHVMGAPDKLDGLLKTLLENACKYGAQSSNPVRISLKRERNMARLSVQNGGSPIPAKDLPHVFERFYRSDKSRANSTDSASFGLGLAIAKSTAEQHKGTIEVQSDEHATTFTVTLPLAK